MTFGSRYTREITNPEDLVAVRVAVNQCWLDGLRRVMSALLPSNIITPHRSEAVAIDDQDVPAPLHERRGQQITRPALSGFAQERAAGLAIIYNAAKAFIRAELNDAPDVDAARADLNLLYEQFVFQYDVIHDPRNQKLFGDLTELQFLLALERNPRRTPSGHWRADRERVHCAHINGRFLRCV